MAETNQEREAITGTSKPKLKKFNLIIVLIIAILLVLIFLFIIYYYNKPKDIKLYWFIPDGARADPNVFNIYEWAEQGKLPNIKKMMEQGSYGYCKPAFPGHTPSNFATLFTGSYPSVHGVNDGPMRAEGNPLDKVSVGGFNSAAKKVEPIWVTLEKSDLNVTLLSIPGSTPPELKKGITIKGRWGGWGADFPAVIFQEKENLEMRKKQGKSTRLFYFGPELIQYINKTAELNTSLNIKSYSRIQKSKMSSFGITAYAYIYDTTNDMKMNYDSIAFSYDEKEIITTLKEGVWSEWLPVTVKWKVPNKNIEKNISTYLKIKIIKLDDNGFFRVRFIYSGINEFLTEPSYVANDIEQAVGPMVDFVDNFPPQLIYYNEDKETFLQEAKMSLEWNRNATRYILKNYKPEVFISDTYTPNQMLTSRWWMGYIDPSSSRYGDISEEKREILWEEVKDMYLELDKTVGVLLENSDENTVIIFTSDHGVIPIDRSVKLNNLFAKKGWLKFKIDNKTGEPIIDWNNSKVIYIQMDHVYINPKGLGGNWKRANGSDYEKLREEVKKSLQELEDENGIKPLEKVVEWTDVENTFRLDKERTGDLIIANRPGYGWSEEMTDTLEVFSTPLISGYKQAVISDNVEGMWAPFIIMGPGVKKNNYLGEQPVDMVDQYPTIMKLLNIKSPDFVQGKVIENALKN